MSGNLGIRMSEPSNLTAIQVRVLQALRRRAEHNEPPPTYRELCFEFHWASTGTVRDHLKALSRKGHVELGGGRARLTRLTEETRSVTTVPIVGHIAAGVPVTAEENLQGRIGVPSEWVRAGVHFAVRVVGESMVGAGISEGDVVLVRKQETGEEGEVVVATLDGETTLKRLRKGGGRVRLVAENPRFKTVDVRTESAVIQGVVVGLLRRFPRPNDVGSQTLRESMARSSP
jgi:repressor LexA